MVPTLGIVWRALGYAFPLNFWFCCAYRFRFVPVENTRRAFYSAHRRPVQVVSLLDTPVCSYSKLSAPLMRVVSLGRFGRLQRVQNWCCSLFIFFLFQIFNSYYRYLQCLFTFQFLTTVLSLFWFVITQPPTQKFQPLMDFLKIFQTVSKSDITWRKVSLFFPSILNFEPNY